MRRARRAVVMLGALCFVGAECGDDSDGAGGGQGGQAEGGGNTTDPCAPYTGSYAGIFHLVWSCPADPTLDGQGEINVHFTAACEADLGDSIELTITSVMSDNDSLGALTETPVDSFVGHMSMPPDLPATAGPSHFIQLEFPEVDGIAHLLSTEGTFEVGTGATQIANQLMNTDAFLVGDDVTSAAGRPDGCIVDSRTYVINKTAL